MSSKRKGYLEIHYHQNPLIHTPSIRTEPFQPINGWQAEAGIGEDHQLSELKLLIFSRNEAWPNNMANLQNTFI